MASNTAAWQNAVGEKLDVRSSPYPSPDEHEMVIQNHAWAVNPVDRVLQERKAFDWLQYPVILGCDVAGTVVQVGSSVTRFKKGDRVLALASSGLHKPGAGAFQQYSLIEPVVTVPIPATMSFAEASVLPLALCTAACGLFQQDQLALQHPSLSPKPTGQTVIVWGGASSVGMNAIQLAVAGGYEVFTTASPKNFDFVGKLGASKAFDYNAATVVEDIVTALENKQFVGLFQAAGDARPSFQIVDNAKGRKFVSSAVRIPEDKPSGVDAKAIWGTTLKDNEVGPAVLETFLPKALAEGKYLAMPEPWVIGQGLGAIQEGFDAQKKGVSAKKIVIIA